MIEMASSLNLWYKIEGGVILVTDSNYLYRWLIV